jgi:hypothetical protein
MALTQIQTGMMADGAVTAAKLASGVAVAKLLFKKADPTIVAWTKTGNGTATTSSILYVEVNNVFKTIASGTSITMPALTAGTDYCIYVCDDDTIRADASASAPSGYTTANSRKIGGFHYSPGGNAAAQAGGNTTPQINEYTFWDLKFRPACPNPAGMTLVADSFWVDIYLTGVDHLTNGTSKYNVTMADGSSPPKIPTKFGGTGTNAYANMKWWVAGEVARSHGKHLLSYDEFAAAAYGTTEATSIGTDQGSTVLNAAYTSRWGMIQSSGVLWVWGNEFGGGNAAASWVANTDGRGSTYQMENAVLLGATWDNGTTSGSRASFWGNSPTDSASTIGSRSACDHLILD